MANTTARDIARKLGLSTASVSVALNGKPGVSSATREKVLAAAAEMGYAASKPPAAGGSRLICFLIYVDPDVGVVLETNFYTFVLKGIEAAATSLGYRTMIRFYYADKPFQEQLGDVLPDLAGLLIMGTEIVPARRNELAPFIGPEPVSFPVVILDNFTYSSQVDSVGNDNRCGARDAIAYLIGRGHRRVGYLRVRQRIDSFSGREEGLRAALREQLGPDAAPEVVPVDVSADGAFRDISAWLETRPALPDVLYAENDFIAASAIRALTARGIRVPEDLSVMGFDDVSVCEMVDPPITTVHSFKERLGREAVGLLHRRIQEGKSVRTARETGLVKLALSTRVVERSSVGSKNGSLRSVSG